MQGCIQKEIQQQFSTARIGNSVHLYQREALQDKNPAGNLKARLSSHVLLAEPHKRRNHVKSLSGMARIQRHIIRPLGPLGPPAVAWLQSNTHCPLGEREIQTKPCLSPWGTETRQRHSGHWVLSIHEMKLNTLKVCRPRGHRRTIGTVTVICGNNLKGFTCRAPRGQSGNLQQHEAANKCLKQFLSFIYTIGTKVRMNLSTVCQLRGSQHSCHDQPGKSRRRHI
jgi:hypothetical protein